MKKTSIKCFWAKFEVSKDDWDSFYSRLAYTRVNNKDRGIWIAKCFVEKNDKLIMCNDEELREIQNHREASHIYPQPFKKVEDE